MASVQVDDYCRDHREGEKGQNRNPVRAILALKLDSCHWQGQICLVAEHQQRQEKIVPISGCLGGGAFRLGLYGAWTSQPV